jgi:uracil-DNA glycosylase
MSADYQQLLDATITHLEGMKARGARHVAVTPETLRALALPVKSQIPNLRSQIAPATAPVSVPQKTVPLPTPFRTVAPVVSAAAPIVRLPSSLPAVSSPEKTAAFAALRERALACVKCPNLVSARKNVVFGVGNIDAELMFVGEAPGADEDFQGEPFVGKAGELLTKIITATGLKRSGNRKPTPEEMQTCIPFLHEQIDLIQPKVLVALGGTAVEGLLGLTGITKLRGQWQTYRGIPLMPTYHPAYLLRNQAMTEKRRVWEDMLAVMEKLALPISEKQRNFFLKA